MLQLDVLYMEWEDMYILSASQLYTSRSKNVFPQRQACYIGVVKLGDFGVTLQKEE